MLDEVERATTTAADERPTEELVEELGRLGCRCVELAVELSRMFDDDQLPPTRRDGLAGMVRVA